MRILRLKQRTGALGFSIMDVLLAVVISAFMLSAMVFLYTRVQRSFIGQTRVANAQSVGSIGFFLIGRDIRRAGSNPVGFGSIAAGKAIPFELATSQQLQILSDLNGDSDVADADENITYSFIDNDPNIPGNDTIQRSDPIGGNVSYITNVYDFQLSYIMSAGPETSAPDVMSDIRMVRVKLTVGTDKVDPLSGQIITRDYENLIGLRNFQ